MGAELGTIVAISLVLRRTILFVAVLLLLSSAALSLGRFPDDAAYHKRLWSELRLLGQQESKLDGDAAENLFRSALSEAMQYDRRGMLTALSLSDLARLSLVKHDPDTALRFLRQAIAIDEQCLSKQSAQTDNRFVKGELVRLKLLEARIEDCRQNRDQSLATCLSVITVAADRLSCPPADLIVCERLKDAVSLACDLSSTADDLSKAIVSLGSLPVSMIPAPYRKSIRQVVVSAINGTEPSAEARLVKLLNEKFPEQNCR